MGKNLVIVGGGAGGASTAAETKRNVPSLKVTILQKGQFVSYASCPTPYYIGDLIKDANKLVARTPERFSHDGIDVQLNTKVINIDTKESIVETKDSRRVPYDFLVMSTGTSDGVVGAQSFRLFNLECAATGLSEKEAFAAGYAPVSNITCGSAMAPALGMRKIGLKLTADKSSGKLLGAQAVGVAGAVGRKNALSVALWAGMDLDQIGYLDLAYAPPFSAVWDIIHNAAQTLKRTI